MTIDPDDYDRRELRRIADEQRDARRSGDDEPADGPGAASESADRQRRDRSDGRSPDARDRSTARGRSDSRDGPDETRERTPGSGNARRRNGRITDRRHADRSSERRRNGSAANRRTSDAEGPRRDDHRRDSDDGVSVRPREDVSRPRRGESDHAKGHDDVVRADRMARDLGFGETPRQRPTQDHTSRTRGHEPAIRGHESRNRNHESRSRQDERRSDASARRSGTGVEADDVGRFQFDTEVRERPRGQVGEALRGNQLEQLLVEETAAADGLAKPYLDSLPDAYAAERLVFDWLEFLVLKGGFKRTMDALRYYHTVEWLTEDVEAELQDYLVGFSGEVSNTTEYDVDDHHLSLVYLARLSSMT